MFEQNPILVKQLRICWKDHILSLRHLFYWFVTLTFKENITVEEADMRFFRWLRKLNEHIYGRRYREKRLGISWIKVIEFQKRNAPHIHALIGGDVDNTNRRVWKSIWENNNFQWTKRKINGFARIEKYDPCLSAAGYLTKSIVNGDEIDCYISHFDRRVLELSDHDKSSLVV